MILERRLAAILAADVVGYSRLMAENEEATLAQLQAHRSSLFNPKVIEHNGRIIKLMGDGTLVEFASVLDAVNCAIAIQLALDASGGAIRLRIGINLGDVIVDGEDIYGDGVNISARLEALANPGGVCVSDLVHQSIRTKTDVIFQDIGEQRLKNIGEPVRVWQWPKGKAGSGKDASSDNVPVPDQPAVAVLPFENMSNDPEQSYFVDGITEDIVTALSKISGLSVVSRASIVNHPKTSGNASQSPSARRPRYLLEGSVRKAGNRVRISAQLSDVATGRHLWAERYDRELDDIFAVQDDITHQIAVEMRVHLSEGEKVRVLAGRTKSVEAWDRLVRADVLTNNVIDEDNLEARRLLEEALEIDPAYAAAWTQLANTYITDVMRGCLTSREEALEQALHATQMALDAEEDYPTAYTIIGYVHLFRGRHDEAVEVLLKAASREPRNAEIVATCAYVLVLAGKADDALETILKAMQFSPISPMWYVVVQGMCYLSRDQPELAVSTLGEAVAMEPESAYARPYLVSALVDSGALDEAEKCAREILKIEPNFSLSLWPGADFKDRSVKTRIIDNLVKAGLAPPCRPALAGDNKPGRQ